MSEPPKKGYSDLKALLLIGLILFACLGGGFASGFYAGQVSTTTLNTWDGNWFTTPYVNATTGMYSEGSLYLGSTADTRLYRSGTDTISLGAGDSLIGATWLNGTSSSVSDLYVNNDVFWGTSNRTDTIVYPEQTATYIIWKSGSKYYAKNGDTGQIQSSGTDASTVIKAAVALVKANGAGSIYFKYANYTLLSKITIDFKHIHIKADTGTIFTSALLPCFEIIGGALDSGNSLFDIIIENIYFKYNGAVGSGKFVYIYGVQNDYTYQGAIILRNLNIRSSQVSVPSDVTFIGLYIDEYVGITLDTVNIAFFGQCITLTGVHECDMLWLENVNLSYARDGIFSTGGGNRMTAVNLKCLFIDRYCLYLWGSPRTTTLIAPQFESFTGNDAILANIETMHLTNPVFTSFTVGIKWGADNADAYKKRLIIENARFTTGTTAIENYCTLISTGGLYLGVTNKILNLGTRYNMTTIKDGFVTTNGGTFSIALHSTTATITHGLSYTPAATDITITWTTVGGLLNCTSWSVTGIGAATFTVNLYDANGAAKGPSGTVTGSWAARKTP